VTDGPTRVDELLDRVVSAINRGDRATATALAGQIRAAADFEQGGDELFATLLALTNYYAGRADLRRLSQVLEALRAGLDESREWFRPVIESLYGNLACIRGDVDTARFQIESADTQFATLADRGIDMVWLMPSDPIVTAQLHLAWALLMHADLDAAESELRKAAQRAERLSSPQGPYSLGFVRFMQIWIRLEAGQLDRAAELSADLTHHAERLGLVAASLCAATQSAAVNAMAVLSAGSPAELAECLATMTTLVDRWRGMGMNLYTTFFDAVIARLLIALEQPDEARRRIESARQLADETQMKFYDAELLRLRGHTYTDPDARAAAFRYAREVARQQGARLFELRAALDDFELRGSAASAGLAETFDRVPADSALPEVVRARAALAAMGHRGRGC
jgi:hypothetical protein